MSRLSVLAPLAIAVAVLLLGLLVFRPPAGPRQPALRFVLVAGALVLTFLLTGALAFVATMLLAGPHSGVLPEPFAPFVLLGAVAVTSGLPIPAARAVMRRWRDAARAPD